MSVELVILTILWCYLYIYIIIASIEFGVGFFAYYGRYVSKKPSIHKLDSAYDPRLWPITIVFFAVFVIGLLEFFPDTLEYFGRALIIPGLVVLLLVFIRFLAHFLYKKEKNAWSFLFIYGSTGLLIPAALSIGLTISEGGFIRRNGGEVELLTWKLFLSPYSWSVVFLAAVSVLYISASFLYFYKQRMGDEAASETARGYALFWSVPTIIASILIIISLRGHNIRHFESGLNLWWLFALSLAFYFGAIYLIYKRKRPGLAFSFVLLQFFTAFFGYGASHLPYILDPFITVQSFKGDGVWLSLAALLIVGVFLIVPFARLIKMLLMGQGNNENKEAQDTF